MSTSDSTKFRPLLLRSIVQALHQIFQENRYADKVIESTLRQNKKSGSRDRAFIAENTYDIVRNYRLYSEILGHNPETHWDFWQICGIHFSIKTQTALPDLIEFKNLKFNEVFIKKEALSITRAVRESIPDWLDELGSQQLPEVWEETLHNLNIPAQVVLRANRLKTDREKLKTALQSEDIETEFLGSADTLLLKTRKNVFQGKAFQSGWFEVQDYSSQKVAPLLAPEPGMRVIDACAGAGGKTLHLAALMENKGSIIALDTHAWKLDSLKKRARRAGAFNIEVRNIENTKTIKRLHNSADRLLLDVPCSGLGVLRRNPDTKWKLSVEQLEELKETQQHILSSYSQMLKAGGKMVYATCSILPSENREQVDKFLQSENGAAFELIEDKTILPQSEGFDGFYMALLEKKP